MPAPRPGPAPGAGQTGALAPPPGPGAVRGPEAAAVTDAVDERDPEVAQVLSDLSATPADAPPLEQAAALERAQERLARRLSGTAR
ncbi:hypothetical protein [uncultured Pseudokineococcus sp.]|uniref:hypothetical protein n=1 Tax=uncultured Pseudokineococcus sp. TaxID=1642928 RepID=UPI0026318069|nr:hypothetical protein [uncultured Pseudokineococcus sp.]